MLYLSIDYDGYKMSVNVGMELSPSRLVEQDANKQHEEEATKKKPEVKITRNKIITSPDKKDKPKMVSKD